MANKKSIGYKIDFTRMTITVTKEYAEKMQQHGSDEYNTIKAIREDYPTMTIVARTHKTPTKYVNKAGEVSGCNQFKNLTYENMERFMNALPDGHEYLEEYSFIRQVAGVQRNGYALVRTWFQQQFPLFRSNPTIYWTYQPPVVKGADILQMPEQGEGDAA